MCNSVRMLNTADNLYSYLTILLLLLRLINFKTLGTILGIGIKPTYQVKNMSTWTTTWTCYFATIVNNFRLSQLQLVRNWRNTLIYSVLLRTEQDSYLKYCFTFRSSLLSDIYGNFRYYKIPTLILVHFKDKPLASKIY